MTGGVANSMPEILQAALFVLVVGAALADLRTRRIPNWIALPGLIAGMVLNGYFRGSSGVASAMLGALLGAAMFLGIYLAGGMGAGDVKLFAAVGAIVGPQSLLVIFVLTGILGGVAALALMLWRGKAGQAMGRTFGLAGQMLRMNWPQVRRRSDLRAPGALTLPYGAVVAGGTLLFLFAVRQPVG